MGKTVMVAIFKQFHQNFLGEVKENSKIYVHICRRFCCQLNGVLLCHPSLLGSKNINCEGVEWPSVAGRCDYIGFRYNKTLYFIDLETSIYYGLVISVKFSALKQQVSTKHQ